MRPAHREVLSVQTDPAALLDAFERYKAPSIPKWINRSET